MSKIRIHKFRKVIFSLINSTSLILLLIADIRAQMPVITVPSPEKEPVEDFTWWYVMLTVLAIGLVGAIFWRFNNKKVQTGADTKSKKSSSTDNSVDGDKELEWLRKNQKLVGKQRQNKYPKPTYQETGARNQPDDTQAADLDSQLSALKDKAEKNLPIFSITKQEVARPYDELPISNDGGLLSAVEQVNEEYEEDEAVREIAVRILTAFKTRNSVEALAQVALYDLSSNIRSKAVTILTDFDHESVYETILLASADPTREVRAAAARGLSRLSFDRADAWTRIAETEEGGRMVQAARAAIEGGLVERTFMRLVHSDRQFAYEGFALLALLIETGETDLIFDALKNHTDINVRRGILHVIKITKNQKALEGLYTLLEQNNLPLELQEEIDKTIEEIGFVTV